MILTQLRKLFGLQDLSKCQDTRAKTHDGLWHDYEGWSQKEAGWYWNK